MEQALFQSMFLSCGHVGVCVARNFFSVVTALDDVVTSNIVNFVCMYFGKKAFFLSPNFLCPNKKKKVLKQEKQSAQARKTNK
jgi:hypothetical protein